MPASLDGVIAVGSTGRESGVGPGARSQLHGDCPMRSSWLPEGAKEEPVASAHRMQGATTPFFGTSFATAVVSGTVGRVLADRGVLRRP